MKRTEPAQDIPQTAAQWFAARRGGVDAAMEHAFQNWLQAEPQHADDYALCEITWDLSAAAAAGLVPRDAGAMSRRRLLQGAALLGAAASAAGAALWFWPAAAQPFTTGAGEQRLLQLQDGSRVLMNTRTQLIVRLGRRSRDLELLGGEAFFEVAPDAARPFTVHTALGSARAVGTHFNVYLQPAHLAVTTAEGRVFVKGGSTGDGVFVDAGRKADVDATGAGAIVAPADVATVLNWRTHRLEVDDEPLARVLEEFSRYTDLPVRPATAAIGALRVSAVLRTGDLAALRATLAEAFGLQIDSQPGEYVVVRSSPATR